MYQHRIFSEGAALAAICILGLAPAFGQECTNADFSGRYAISTENRDAEENRVGGNVGTLFADGQGTITEWTQTSAGFSTQTGERIVVTNDFAALIAVAGNVITYAVGADCRIVVSGDFGAFQLEGVAAIAHHGKVIPFQMTSSPDGTLASGVFRSLEPIASEEISAVKQLLDRIAIRNGLRP